MPKKNQYDEEVERLLNEPHVVNLLFRAYRTLQARLAAKAQGLALSEARLLLALRDGASIGQIAVRTETSRQYVSRVVRELEGRGFVRTTPDPADARSTLVVVEPAGQEYFAVLDRAKGQLDAELSDQLGAERLHRLVGALQEIIEGPSPSVG